MSRKEIIKELHKKALKKFPRRKVILKGIDDLWQADLVEMIPYSKQNNNYKYLLTVIDCFSKYAWAKPVLNKTSTLVTKAMLEIIKESGRIPINLHTDNGKEFYNKIFDELMKKYNINHYSTYTHLKASIVERFNRTLKDNMWKLFSMQGSYKWCKQIELLLYKYNHTKHRTIKMTPNEVNKKTEKMLLKTIFKQSPVLVKNKYNIGDNVRVSKYKTIFEKGYTPNWTTEIFTILSVNNKSPVTYLLKDYKNQMIAGRFYEKELQLVKYPDAYLIEKVIKRTKDKSFVKWLGFDNSHNSWIKNTELI